MPSQNNGSDSGTMCATVRDQEALVSAHDDEVQRFWDRLIEAHGVPTCAVCQQASWRIGAALAVPALEETTIRPFGAPRVLALSVVCQVCRNTLLFTGTIISTEDADVP